MYKKDLDALISANKLPNFMLIRSNDEFLNEIYASEILEIWSAGELSKDEIYKIYYDEYDFENIKGYLEPSLFSSKNIVHLKTDKLVKTKELKEIISILLKNSDNFFLYELFEGRDFKISNDFIKVFDGNFVRLFKPANPNEAIQILNKKALNLGLKINQNAIFEIYKIHNENLSLSSCELEKFASLNLELNLENVKENVFGLSEISFEEIFNKIINLKDFRNEFFIYIQSGSYNENELLGYLYASFFRIFQIHSYIKINGKLDIKEILGYIPPPQIQANLKNDALKFNTIKFREIFIFLNELDYDLKTKKDLNKTYFMLSALIKLQKLLAQK
ncbi:hypothetical protein F1B92_06040 [Campylobacter sp. FMV-PI01]|uniref:Uncharacterized protein n=1 Tax=Campylobacter portucalensis TaxID=2608384 RepID=A0A6L5WI43_9BACT|nr:hypothetical protein [Campylobacter portucalensis]MSN96724.1 hypothetical protein [Campylobacter portucalensis]